MKFVKVVLWIFIFSFFNSCILFKQNVTKPVVIKVVFSGIFTSLNKAEYSKYLSRDVLSYQNEFISGFNAEARKTDNVTIDNYAVNPDFILYVRNIALTERTYAESVSNPNSEFNGRQFTLYEVDCYAELDCIDAKTNKQIGPTCFSDKSKKEQLTNNRTLGEIIFGQNMDNTNYRQKELYVDVALELAYDVGKRIWVPITKRISKGEKSNDGNDME
ncbi:MAG: hypothetical protein CFE21_03495 [Bacteroidetes bacterium B1(2017)]|nr:MAG: hypothetical protein CFE21_03495 [Bacteroidetes bacterium B1(2017)]